MPFSHHSHSGQFCSHATDALEEVVRHAISKKFRVFALTEHIPRREEDLYPGENETLQSLSELFDKYYAEAVRLRAAYAGQIELLVGFEGEWIRGYSAGLIRGLRAKYAFDTFVGSVHHVHASPVDFDRALYERAREAAGGTDELLAGDYFDDQMAMLSALLPPVVGHFDLIRLKSDDPEHSFRAWDGVWRRIRRNLEFVAGYGGLVEINSAALRKGMSEPYPCMEIAQEFLALGGRFVLSDDSHGVAHVGLHYDKVLDFVRTAGIRELYFVRASPSARGLEEGEMPSLSRVNLAELEADPFWTAVA